MKQKDIITLIAILQHRIAEVYNMIQKDPTNFELDKLFLHYTHHFQLLIDQVDEDCTQ